MQANPTQNKETAPSVLPAPKADFMSASPADPRASSPTLPPLVSLGELLAAPPPPIRWLWDGTSPPARRPC
jgi:hypothetical protein